MSESHESDPRRGDRFLDLQADFEGTCDVDCAILLPDNFHEQVSAGDENAIELLGAIITREPKELLFAEVEEDWWGWVEFFGRTRELNGRRKGLIEVML